MKHREDAEDHLFFQGMAIITTLFIINDAPYGNERGMKEDDMRAGAHRFTLAELANWQAEADKVLVF